VADIQQRTIITLYEMYIFISSRKPHVIGQKVDTCDFKIETLLVNEVHKHSTTPTSGKFLHVMKTNYYPQ